MGERQRGAEREPKQVVREQRQQCRPAGISGNTFSPPFVKEYRDSLGAEHPRNSCSFSTSSRTGPLRGFTPKPAGSNLGHSSHESHGVFRPDPGGGAVRGREHQGPRAHPAGCHEVQEGHRQGKRRALLPSVPVFLEAAFVPGELNMALSCTRRAEFGGVGGGCRGSAGFCHVPRGSCTLALRSKAAAFALLPPLFAAFAEKGAAPLWLLRCWKLPNFPTVDPGKYPVMAPQQRGLSCHFPRLREAGTRVQGSGGQR